MSDLATWRAEREFTLAARAARERGDSRTAARIVLARDDFTVRRELEVANERLRRRNARLIQRRDHLTTRLERYERVEEAT
jgi:hypothetical protein